MLRLIILAVAASAQILDLQEGAICPNGGTCRRLENCKTTGDLRVNRPPICSFDSTHPIVCCPPEPAVPLSVQKCREYSRAHCQVGLLRAKRQLPFLPLANRPSVVGGTLAKPRELTYMALIGYGNASSIEWACGASIVNKRFILTAAHCVNAEFQGEAKWVRVGELNLSNNNEDARPTDFSIEQSYMHPQYKPPATYHDIALLRLSKDIFFNDWIKPICLHTKKELTEAFATAAGWGRTDFAGPTSDSLLKVNLTIFEGNDCKKRLGNAGRFIPRGVDPTIMICAGDREGGRDTCSGDSGGPLVVRSEYGCMSQQIGIVSFGRYCGLANTPAVYTRVAHYVPWIESIVWPINSANKL